jgi:sec-independent protein translocase protein TatA
LKLKLNKSHNKPQKKAGYFSLPFFICFMKTLFCILSGIKKMNGYKMNFGLQEFIIIFVIVLILFGGKRIPEIVKNLGASVKNFKTGIKDEAANESSEDKK